MNENQNNMVLKPENFDRSWLSSDDLKIFLSEYFFK